LQRKGDGRFKKSGVVYEGRIKEIDDFKGRRIFMPKKLILPREVLYNFYETKKLSLKQTAAQLNCGKTSVHRYLKCYGIKIRNSKEGQNLRLKQEGRSWFHNYIKDELTELQKQMILGTVLGDGSLYVGKRNKNARLKIEHSKEDKEYLIFKHSILRNFVSGKIMKRVGWNKKTAKFYTSYVFITVTHPEFTKFYQLFHKEKKKIVNEDILEQLTPFSLAIWIMDDGNYNRKHNFIDLYTMNFSLEENLLIKNCIEKKFKIFPEINFHKQAKKYFLRFNVMNTKRLVKIIAPFIIPCMKRKIGD